MSINNQAGNDRCQLLSQQSGNNANGSHSGDDLCFLSQTPAEAAGTRTRVTWCACLPLTFCWYQIMLCGSIGKCVWTNCPELHSNMKWHGIKPMISNCKTNAPAITLLSHTSQQWQNEVLIITNEQSTLWTLLKNCISCRYLRIHHAL